MSRAQRRQKFVDAKVQGALARRLIFHWLLFVTVGSTAAFVLQVLSDPFRPTSDHLRELWWTHGPFVMVMIFMLPIFVMDTIKLSHRFAGPVVSLRRAMRDVAAGQAPRKLQFRTYDYWHELAEEYNAMIDRLAPHAEKRDEVTEKTETSTAIAN